LIRTTPEHPFFVHNKGWTAAGALVAGDWISTATGWVPVEEVYDTGEYETVYNLRVADHHTYFVGEEAWGFAVWAHNVYYPKTAAGRQQIADALVGAGFLKTTQRQAKNNVATIEQMATEMQNGTFDWSRVDEKIVIDSNGVVLNGNHRVIASALSGVPIPSGQIVRLQKPTRLDVYEWTDTLPPPTP